MAYSVTEPTRGSLVRMVRVALLFALLRVGSVFYVGPVLSFVFAGIVTALVVVGLEHWENRRNSEQKWNSDC